jgi:hypothetical protein
MFKRLWKLWVLSKHVEIHGEDKIQPTTGAELVKSSNNHNWTFLPTQVAPPPSISMSDCHIHVEVIRNGYLLQSRNSFNGQSTTEFAADPKAVSDLLCARLVQQHLEKKQ